MMRETATPGAGRGVRPARRYPWVWFLAWAMASGAYAAGIVGAAALGIVAFPVAIVVTVLLLGRRVTLVGLPGVGLGAAGALFDLAYTDRRGPGTVCQELAGGSSFRCVTESSPWPWLAGGVTVVVLAVSAFLVVRQRLKPSNA